jgi:hypothetical protein
MIQKQLSVRYVVSPSFRTLVPSLTVYLATVLVRIAVHSHSFGFSHDRREMYFAFTYESERV